MNKKMLTIAGSVVFGGMLLSASAYAAISTDTGYDTYKSALKNTITLKSVTPKVALTIKDNGANVADVTSTLKVSKADSTMSGTVAIATSGKNQTLDIFKTGTETVLKSSYSDIYNVSKENGKDFGKNRKDEATDPQKTAASKENHDVHTQDVEKVFDAIAGNFVNYTTLSTEADGTKDVTFKLSENQISPVLNAAASLAIKNIGTEKMHKEGMEQSFALDLKNKLPKLETDIKVTNIDVEAKINKDNFISGQTANIAVSGKDASGVVHNVTISLSADLSDYNATSPDKIDLTGKQVKEAQPRQGERD